MFEALETTLSTILVSCMLICYITPHLPHLSIRPMSMIEEYSLKQGNDGHRLSWFVFLVRSKGIRCMSGGSFLIQIKIRVYLISINFKSHPSKDSSDQTSNFIWSDAHQTSPVFLKFMTDAVHILFSYPFELRIGPS